MRESYPFLQPGLFAGSYITKNEVYHDVKWDFENDKPVFKNGEPVIVNGIEAVASWALRALRTERYKNTPYSWDYGNEVAELIGRPWQEETRKAEAVRYVSECLQYHPQILGVNSVTLEFENGKIALSCILQTEYGNTNLRTVI